MLTDLIVLLATVPSGPSVSCWCPVMSALIEQCLEGTQKRISSSLQLLAVLRCEFACASGSQRKLCTVFQGFPEISPHIRHLLLTLITAPTCALVIKIFFPFSMQIPIGWKNEARVPPLLPSSPEPAMI